MKRLFISLLCACVSAAGSLHASIGETLAQCIEHYGPVQEEVNASLKQSDAKACIFSKKGVTTLVEFKGGVAWRIVFRMQGMTPADADALLRANLPPGGWGSSLKFDGQEYRLSADRRRISMYAPTKSSSELGTLTITTREYGAANHADYAARVGKALEGAKDRKPGTRLEGF